MRNTDPIQITLMAGEWNRIMQMLGTHPYEEVVTFINSIQAQCLQVEMNQSIQNRETMGRVSGQDPQP